ncbi:MAG TPA: hypothetical protein VGQ08_10515 [Nitrospiraceae bacterium]|nr:hypothetical protein [Nitrospiraceae bacterium]
MTSGDAAVLRAKWENRVDPRPCAHLTLELEQNDSGYLTGNYTCIACGESVARKHQLSRSRLIPDQPITPTSSGSAPLGSLPVLPSPNDRTKRADQQ